MSDIENLTVGQRIAGSVIGLGVLVGVTGIAVESWKHGRFGMACVRICVQRLLNGWI